MGLHHCIQLCTGSGLPAAAEPSGDAGMMSTQLYLALCEGRKKEAVAMLAADQIAGKPPITTHSCSGVVLSELLYPLKSLATEISDFV
jgi:hypothetical protein